MATLARQQAVPILREDGHIPHRRVQIKAHKPAKQQVVLHRSREIGALLRREGIYSSQLATWRKQRAATERAGLEPQKRGRKADPTLAEARQRVLSAAYAAHPERFVRKPPQPPMLPHAVWINPPKEESASQDRTGATISTADDR